MAKITLNTITSSFSATSLFNTNFASITTELNDKVLYRTNPTGEANQMSNVLDMNTNDVINVAQMDATGISINGVDVVPTGTTTIPATGLTYDNTTSGLTATNVQAALDEIDSDLDAHLADAVDAHDASAISNVPSGNLVATEVQAALDELQTEIDAHLADTVDSHDASSISNVASGNLVATEVQAALDELQTELDSATSGVATNVTNITSNDTQLARGSNHGRNLIINGDFSVNQREVSGTVVLASGVYGHDRMKGGSSGCTYTFATSAGVTTITISAGTLQQVIEATNLPATDVVLSWTGTAQGKIDSGSFGASGAVTDTTTGGTNVTVEFDTGTLSHIQLEEGSVATDFEIISSGNNLTGCQRYTFVPDLIQGSSIQSISYGFATSTTILNAVLELPVTMRAIPGVVVTNPTAFKASDGVTGTVATALAKRIASATTVDLQLTVASGLTQFRSYRIERDGTFNGKIVVSAEL